VHCGYKTRERKLLLVKSVALQLFAAKKVSVKKMNLVAKKPKAPPGFKM